ncbi:Eco57I restriction-modification methylase domain-containing protein [Pseudomonas viridiflava]|uniref:Eco57I restriction-modification methylase domain-containing protein n=1 Tax=Pseudomonas viridiflava TaxID=33069 RepID=UPI000F05E8E3|nr:N-6 DNA methylase [Pseudomonas viridiflava]
MNDFFDFEEKRLDIQSNLDLQKSQLQRNKMGQFATPTELANDILSYAKKIHPESQKVDFLDPAIGTGSFYSALRNVFDDRAINSAKGFEIDPHYGEPSKALWAETPLNVTLADFTTQLCDHKSNLLICNPPYVRHHHLEASEKKRLKELAYQAAGIKISGLAGLYCYFLAISHSWMTDNGIAAWLIPSEFMDVNYGKQIKEYLLNEVTLLHIHRFDPSDVQFSDALVSSAVVWFKKTSPSKEHSVEFSYGGTLNVPRIKKDISTNTLKNENKWSRFPVSEAREKHTSKKISDYFKIRRGIATGDNGFFIRTEKDIRDDGLALDFFSPILPSSRYLPLDVIESDDNGYPLLEKRLFLLDLKDNEETISREHPRLHEYLQRGKTGGVSEKYLCKSRPLWYKQENRGPSPFICTYMGRSDGKTEKPFRFILNRSKAKITNSYLAMYPCGDLEIALAENPELANEIWRELNSITSEELLGEGRVYGGGLHKLEPKELANVPVPGIELAINRVLERNVA